MSVAAIIGAGPAGQQAAAILERAGVPHDLFDEQPQPGGNIGRQRAGAPHPQSNTRFRPNCTVLAVRPGLELQVLDADQLRIERYDMVLAAPGACDLILPLRGLAESGSVSTAGALQALLKGEGIVPRGRVVIAGAGPFLHVVAAGLVQAGAAVTHVIDRLRRRDYAALAPWSPTLRQAGEMAACLAVLRRAGTCLRFGQTPDRVTANQLFVDGSAIPFDRLALSDGFAAQSQLARTAGAGLFIRAGDYVAVAADAAGRTRVAGLFVAGEAAGVRGAGHAAASGALAALAMLDQLGVAAPPLNRARLHRTRRLHARFGDALERTIAARSPLGADDAVLCRCEGVPTGAVRNALRHGLQDLSSVKVVTRCGMGPCQGRLCEPLLLRAFREAGVAPRGVLTQQAFARPLAAAILAGG